MTATAPTDFRLGQRVQINAWAGMGDGCGEVVAIGRKWVTVKIGRKGKTFQVAPDLLTVI